MIISHSIHIAPAHYYCQAIMFFERSQHGPPIWHRGPHGPGGISGFMTIRLPPDIDQPPSLVGPLTGLTAETPSAASSGPRLLPPPREPADSIDEFSSAADDPDVDVAEGDVVDQQHDHAEAPKTSIHVASEDNQAPSSQSHAPSSHGKAPIITGHWSPPLFFTEGTVPEDVSIGEDEVSFWFLTSSGCCID